MTPRVHSNIDSGPWVIMMYQCRFIRCDKCTPLAGDVDNGEGCACMRQRVFGKFLYLPVNFAVNLKLLYEYKVFKKIKTDNLS